MNVHDELIGILVRINDAAAALQKHGENGNYWSLRKASGALERVIGELQGQQEKDMDKELQLEEIKTQLLKNMEERNALILKAVELGYEVEVHREWFDMFEKKYLVELDTAMSIGTFHEVELPVEIEE